VKDLSDVAQDSAEVILARDQQGRAFEIVTAGAMEADEITPEGEFPQYGEFLPCRNSPDGSSVYVELPQGLAQELTRDGSPDPREGLVFVVNSIRKTADGSWRYDVEYPGGWDEASEALNGS